MGCSMIKKAQKQFVTFLCVSSLRRGHANLLCIVPILTDVLASADSRHIGFVLPAYNCKKTKKALTVPYYTAEHQEAGTGALRTATSDC